MYAALLRGINVGGRNRVPMPELKALFEKAGHEDVVTYIQSGNVVFRSRTADAATLAADLERRIETAFGPAVAVVLRSPDELAEIAVGNPFLTAGSDTSKLYVVFLRSQPAPGALERLDAGRSPGDEFRLTGRDLYLRLPTGAGRTKLTLDYFERILGVKGTARNWNTLLRLCALTGVSPEP